MLIWKKIKQTKTIMEDKVYNFLNSRLLRRCSELFFNCNMGARKQVLVMSLMQSIQRKKARKT
jgi:hypothetical protein